MVGGACLFSIYLHAAEYVRNLWTFKWCMWREPYENLSMRLVGLKVEWRILFSGIAPLTKKKRWKVIKLILNNVTGAGCRVIVRGQCPPQAKLFAPQRKMFLLEQRRRGIHIAPWICLLKYFAAATALERWKFLKKNWIPRYFFIFKFIWKISIFHFEGLGFFQWADPRLHSYR